MRAVTGFMALLLTISSASADAQEPDSVLPLPALTVRALPVPLELADAPLAFSVVPSEALAARPGLGLDEALDGVPGLQVDARFNDALGDRISIRGFGARSQFGVRGISVLVDGVPATLPDGQTALSHLDPRSIAHALVVRGPASTLYGNAAGGALLLETAPPVAGPLHQSLGIVGGEAGLLRLESNTTGGWGSAGLRLRVARKTFDGYREHGASEQLFLNARVSAPFAGGELGAVLAGVDYEAQNPGSLSDSLLRVDRTAAFRGNLQHDTGEDARQGQLGLRWRRGFEEGALEVAAWGLSRDVDNPIPFRIIALERTAAGLHTRWTSGAGRRVGWSIALEGGRQWDGRRNFENRAGARGELVLDQAETVTSGAVAAQLGFEPRERLHLLAGLRGDAVRFAVTDHFTDGDPDDTGVRTLTAISPSGGVLWEVAGATALFANASTAFETPTTSELANRPGGAGGFNPELEPQRTVSVEAGARGGLFGRGRWELVAYRARVQDALVPFQVAGAEGRTYFRNAASAVHRGVEGSAAVGLPHGLDARLAYAWTEARFERFATGGEAFDGNRLPGVPPHRLDAAVAWARGELRLEAEARWQAEVPVDDANQVHADAYTLVDVRGRAGRLVVGGFAIEPFAGVTNALDRDYVASYVVNAFGGRFFEPGPGRSFYAGMDVGF